MKYSIWITPSEPIFSQLEKIINDISQKYNAPVFKPHMTLVSGVEQEVEKIKEVAEQLTSSIETLSLSLGPVSFSTTFFQSVFVRVNSNAQLMQLNIDAKKLLNVENTFFMPHISVLYGDHDMQTRETIASEIHFGPTSFSGDKMLIIPEVHTPSAWEPAGSYSFGKI